MFPAVIGFRMDLDMRKQWVLSETVNNRRQVAAEERVTGISKQRLFLQAIQGLKDVRRFCGLQDENSLSRKRLRNAWIPPCFPVPRFRLRQSKVPVIRRKGMSLSEKGMTK